VTDVASEARSQKSEDRRQKKIKAEKAHPLASIEGKGVCYREFGGVLLSHMGAHAVPSAQKSVGSHFSSCPGLRGKES